MNTSKFSRLKLAAVLALFVCACAFFASCSNPVPASLEGTWDSGYDGYVITEDKITYDDGGWGFGWSGDIVDVSDEYIYVKKADKDFYVVAYKGLTDKACSFSNAYKFDGKTSVETLKDAKKEFTIENGYFAFYSDCAKK